MTNDKALQGGLKKEYVSDTNIFPYHFCYTIQDIK